MTFTAAIDMSTFVWSQEDFNTNKHYYYQLISLAPTVYKQITAKKIPVLLRTRLLELLQTEFPYNNINEINTDYSWTTLSFLTNVNWFSYEDGNTSNLSTTPHVAKKHFSEDITKETCNQIAHLYANKQPEHKFIAYHNFYKYDKNLAIFKGGNVVEIDTLCYSTEKEIIEFFEKHKITFKHNPKHDRYKAGGKISPLSCYNERSGDTTKAQQLLESAHFLNNEYFNYDGNNDVYVVFVASNDGTYHGFDLSDEENNVPNAVKKKFNKNGRRF